MRGEVAFAVRAVNQMWVVPHEAKEVAIITMATRYYARERRTYVIPRSRVISSVELSIFLTLNICTLS